MPAALFLPLLLLLTAEPRTDRLGDPLPDGAVARLGTFRLRSTASDLVVSADGRTLLTVSGGRTVAHVDAATGLLRDELHLSGASPMSGNSWLAPDGRTLAVAEEGGLVVWDTANGKRRLDTTPEHAAFSRDGRTLATADYRDSVGHVRLWDLETGAGRLLTELPSYANDLAFSPDGKRLFAAVDNHSLRCWDVASGRQLWMNDHWASYVTVSSDGKLLGTDSYQRGSLGLWDADTGKARGALGKEKEITIQISFSPDGKYLAQAMPKEVRIWDVTERKPVRSFPVSGRVAFAPDSRSLYTLGPLLLRWDIASGKLLYTDTRDRGHVGPVLSVAFAPDGRSLASSGSDGTVRLWNVADGTERRLRNDGPQDGLWLVPGSGGISAYSVIPLQFTPDGRQLLTDAAPGAVALTDVATGKEVRRFELPRPREGGVVVAAAQLTPDGRRLYAVGQTYLPPRNSVILESLEPVRAWDAATGQVVFTGTMPGPYVGRPVFSPDGQLLKLPENHMLREVRFGGQRPLLGIAADVCLGPMLGISPDGRLLAAAESADLFSPRRAVCVFEIATGRLLARIEAPLDYPQAHAFSPDSRLLTVSGPDALHVWDATTGEPLLRLAVDRLPHWTGNRFVACLAFAPDGRTLASGHADGTILLWDMTPAYQALPTARPASGPAACWDDLLQKDPQKAYFAIASLAATPEPALALLRRQLHAERLAPGWLAARLADLDSESFETREAATHALQRIAARVEPELRRAREKAPSAEAKRRLDQILEALDAGGPGAPSAEELRQLRALVVLERIGSEEARTLLRELADGDSGARLTQEAKAVLLRGTKR